MFFNYHITAYKNFMGQIFQTNKQKSSLHVANAQDRKDAHNIDKIYRDKGLLSTLDSTKGVFAQQAATP